MRLARYMRESRSTCDQATRRWSQVTRKFLYAQWDANPFVRSLVAPKFSEFHLLTLHFKSRLFFIIASLLGETDRSILILPRHSCLRVSYLTATQLNTMFHITQYYNMPWIQDHWITTTRIQHNEEIFKSCNLSHFRILTAFINHPLF